MSVSTAYTTFLVNAAEAAAFSFGETRTLPEPLCPLPAVQLAPSVTTPRSNNKPQRLISNPDWQALRPRIKCLYLDENKTYPDVACVLRNECGFYPTKRQFFRKVDEWHFKKNVRQSERRRIQQNLELRASQQSLDILDRRIGPGKLRNWRRKYGKEVSVKRCLPAQYSRVVTPECQNVKASTRIDEDVPQKSGMQDPSEANSMIQQSNTRSGKGDLSTFASHTESLDDAIGSTERAAVDMPRHPSLIQLINGIDNEISKSVLPVSNDTRDTENSLYISVTEMLDLCNEGNKPLIYETDMSCSSKFLSPLQAPLKRHKQMSPWRDPEFPFCRWSESPYNEIYLYPASPTIAAYQHTSSRKPLWTRLESYAAELRSVISKLESKLNPDNPGTIPMKEILAAIYLRQGSYQKAEEIYRHVEKAIRKQFGPTSLETIVAGQNMARVLQYQGRYLQAQNILSEILPKALEWTGPTHTIVTETILQMAVIAQDLNEDEKAEEQVHQVLQILQSTLGLDNYRTRKCMWELGYALNKKGKYLEAENLLHTALQLDYKFAVAGEAEDLCDTMRDLSLTLNNQKRYKESESVARCAVERFEESLGAAHPAILKARLRIAWTLADQDRYQASEDICRSILKKQQDSLGESHPDTLSTISLLAISLEEMGRLEEATGWYEKEFWGDLRVYGPAGQSTISSCGFLGKCYEDQKRYDDAKKLYQQLMEKIRDAEGDGHQAIAEIEGWIERIKNPASRRDQDVRVEETKNATV